MQIFVEKRVFEHWYKETLDKIKYFGNNPLLSITDYSLSCCFVGTQIPKFEVFLNKRSRNIWIIANLLVPFQKNRVSNQNNTTIMFHIYKTVFSLLQTRFQWSEPNKQSSLL